MKIKQLLPLLLFAGLFFTNTQNLEAQTKEETIAWIKRKFENYRYIGNNWDGALFKKYVVEITPCKIIIEDIREWEGDVYCIKTNFPVTSHITTEYTDKGFIMIIPDEHTDLVNKESYCYGKYQRYDSLFRIFNRESNFAERMQKALRHLATFCEKEKEAF